MFRDGDDRTLDNCRGFQEMILRKGLHTLRQISSDERKIVLFRKNETPQGIINQIKKTIPTGNYSLTFSLIRNK